MGVDRTETRRTSPGMDGEGRGGGRELRRDRCRPGPARAGARNGSTAVRLQRRLRLRRRPDVPVRAFDRKAQVAASQSGRERSRCRCRRRVLNKPAEAQGLVSRPARLEQHRPRTVMAAEDETSCLASRMRFCVVRADLELRWTMALETRQLAYEVRRGRRRQ